MGYVCAALRGSGARVSVCGYADMGRRGVFALRCRLVVTVSLRMVLTFLLGTA